MISDALRATSEINRVLKHNGEILLIVPSLEHKDFWLQPYDNVDTNLNQDKYTCYVDDEIVDTIFLRNNDCLCDLFRSYDFDVVSSNVLRVFSVLRLKKNN